MSLKDFTNCRGRACIQQIEKRSRNVLKIDWKPISVWPEEAKSLGKEQIISIA